MGLRVVDVKTNSPEWSAWRIGKLGASTAAAVLNECKFKTAYELFLEMTNRKPAFEGNAATERGHELEPKAWASYEIDQGFCEAPELCLMHPDHDNIIASLDGYRHEDKIILEIKCPSRVSHEMAMKGEVPRHYWIQMQHQMMCAPEAVCGHYWSFLETGALVKVLPDIEFQKHLLALELAFLDLVKNDTPPPLTERDAKLVDSDEIKNLFERLTKAKDKKAEADELKASIIRVGGHNKIRCGNYLVSKTITKTGKESYRLTVSGGQQ